MRSYTDHAQSPDWRDPQLIEDWATKLAELHQIAQGHRHPARLSPESLAPYHWPLRAVLTRRDEFLADMTARLRVEQDVMAVRAGLDRLSKETAHLDLGPVGITHQDPSPGNVLVKDRGVVAVVDWDRAQEDRLLYDAVLAALHLARYQPADDRFSAAERFIKTYQRTWGVDDQAVGWMFRYAVLRNLAVSRSPEKWRAIRPEVERRWGGDH